MAATDVMSTAQLVTSGAFAREVTDELRPALVDARYTVVGPEAVGSIGLVVADHGDPVISGAVQTWHAEGIPSLMVVQDHPDVRVGPWDVPGTDLCARCFWTRAGSSGIGAASSGERSPDGHLVVGVDGFPPYLIALVVALTTDRLSVLGRDPAGRRNELTVVNMAMLTTRTLEVVPVHGCRWCFQQRPLERPMFAELDGVPR
jgi:bacteriocin biosynthesis cyclodehydratase domain-containing protein